MELFEVTERGHGPDFPLSESCWIQATPEELNIVRVRVRTSTKEYVHLVNTCRIENTKFGVASLGERTFRLMVQLNEETEFLERTLPEEISVPPLSSIYQSMKQV